MFGRRCVVLASLASLMAMGAACNDRPPASDDETGGFSGDGTSGADADASGDGADAGEGDDGGEGGEPTPEFAPCNGDPRAASLGIEAVRTPESYALPVGDGVITVADPAALVEALAAGHSDVVLADGVYDLSEVAGLEPGPLRLDSQRLWSEHLGGARLRFGVLAVGSGGASEVHGLKFEAMSAGFEAVHVDGEGVARRYAVVAGGAAGRGFVAEDAWFDGGAASDGALRLDNPAGVVLARLEVSNYRRSGIELGRDEAALGPDEASLPVPSLSDLAVENIVQPEGADAELRFEQWGVRLNDRVDLRRVRIRHTGWAGVVLSGRTQQSLLESVDVDDVVGDLQPDAWGGSVGIGLDETSRDVRLRRFCVGPATRIGVNGQWYGEPQPALHAVRPVVSEGLIQSRRFGLHFDAGSVAVVAFDLILENYGRAGIVYYQNLSAEDLLDTTPLDPGDPEPPNPAAAWSESASLEYDNSFSPACPGAPELSLAHWNSHETCPGS